MIKPTVGRIVYFFIRPDFASHLGIVQREQPLAAQIVYVWNDTMVNLDVTDADGHHHAATSVTLVQDGDLTPVGASMYCEWMPYQKGQAAKTEALEVAAGAKSA